MATPSTHNNDTIVASTTSETDDAASTRALNTPELLENIIVNLSSADAINIRQVCKYWKSVTESTKQLRQHVFLEAAPLTEVLAWRIPLDGGETVPTIVQDKAALEAHAARAEIINSRGAWYDDDKDDTEYQSSIRRLHPILRRMPQRGIAHGCSWIDFVLSVEPMAIDRIGDWRKMLICQPPCTFKDIYMMGGTDKYYLATHEPDLSAEVTLGALVDYAANARKEYGAEAVTSWGKFGVRITASTLSDGDHAKTARGERCDDSAYMAELGVDEAGGSYIQDVPFGIRWI